MDIDDWYKSQASILDGGIADPSDTTPMLNLTTQSLDILEQEKWRNLAIASAVVLLAVYVITK